MLSAIFCLYQTRKFWL